MRIDALCIENITKDVQPIVQKAYDRDKEAILESFMRVYGAGFEKFNPEFKIVWDDTHRASIVSVNLGRRMILSFLLQSYPACCAMIQINHFNYYMVPERFVHTCMDKIITSIRTVFYARFRRVVMNFVETPSNGRAFAYGDTNIPVKGTNLDRMQYKYLYTWATTHRHQQLLTVNHNTGNIIHFVDVMMDYQNHQPDPKAITPVEMAAARSTFVQSRSTL